MLLLLSIIKFYEPCFDTEAEAFDQSSFQDKLMDFVLKLIFAEGSSTLYKVCHSMCRFETNEEEKTLATLITSQKVSELKTSDCNIAPIFQLYRFEEVIGDQNSSSTPQKPGASHRFHYDQIYSNGTPHLKQSINRIPECELRVTHRRNKSGAVAINNQVPSCSDILG